jgi:GT2 family glycosyltransferase
MWNQTSISKAYNDIAKMIVHRHDVKMLVLLHDDLELTDPDAEQKFLEVFDDRRDVGAVGVAGANNVKSIAWWGAETVGHQQVDTGLLTFTRRGPLSVEYLEGSVMAFSPDVFRQGLWFDEDYTGFHGYDDIGVSLRRADWDVVVADIDTHHHTSLGFKSPESAESWRTADRIFRRKYGL